MIFERLALRSLLVTGNLKPCAWLFKQKNRRTAAVSFSSGRLISRDLTRIKGAKYKKAFFFQWDFVIFSTIFPQNLNHPANEKQRHCPCPPRGEDLQGVLSTVFQSVALYKIHHRGFVFRIVNGGPLFSR
jgi:hypothetical protein